MYINFTSIGFTNSTYRCCKKEKLKDETSKKIRETNGSQYIEPASVSRICKKGKVKDEASKKNS